MLSNNHSSAYPIPTSISEHNSPGLLRPHDTSVLQPDSPLLGWRTSLENTLPEESAAAGAKKLDGDDERSYVEGGRNSIDSDLYDDYYSDHLNVQGATDPPALSALSALLNTKRQRDLAQDAVHDQYEREDYQIQDPPRSLVEQLQPNPPLPGELHSSALHLMSHANYKAQHEESGNQAGLPTFLTSTSEWPPNRASPVTQTDNQRLESEKTSYYVPERRDDVPFHPSAVYPAHGNHLRHAYPDEAMASTLSTTSASTTSLSTSNTPPSSFTSPPPSVYRSNSNLSRAPSSSSNQSHSASYSPMVQPLSSPLQYSQPIPRPNWSPNRSPSSYNASPSTYSAQPRGSGGWTPPGTHHSQNRTPPPVQTALSHQSKRQSGLRSSIVSGDLDWRDGEDEVVYKNGLHDHHPDLLPATSTTGSSASSPVAVVSHSPMDSFLPSTAGGRISIHGRSSRATSQYQPQPPSQVSSRSPPLTSVALARSGSSPGVLSRPTSKANILARMHNSPTLSPHGQATDLPLRTQAGEYSLHSPTDSVSPTLPMGMASTTDEAVHLSHHTNSRSRASSAASLNHLDVIPAVPPLPVQLRTSTVGQPMMPTHVSKSSREWEAVEERVEIEGEPEAQTDGEDEDVTYRAGLGVGLEQSKRAVMTAQSTGTPSDLFMSPVNGVTDQLPSERQRFSTGSSSGFGTYETDDSAGFGPGGQAQGLGNPRASCATYSEGRRDPDSSFSRMSRSTTLEETDTSEVSEDDYEEENSREIEEERTAAIMLVEQGGGLIVNASGLGVGDFDIRPGTTHIIMSGLSTPNQVPPFLTGVLPGVSRTLLALDISCNYLASLPPALSKCESLEELNITGNPLRVLPIWLGDLTQLRVLIADSTGIGNLPPTLAYCTSLRTLSVRKNRMYSLPGWLSQLNHIEWLLVSGNPFQGPWKSLLDPLSDVAPGSAVYPPNTPFSAMSMGSANSDGSAGSPLPEGLNIHGIPDTGALSDQTIKFSAYNSLQPSPLSTPSSAPQYPSNLMIQPGSQYKPSTSVPSSAISSRPPSIYEQAPSPSYFPPTVPNARPRPERAERQPTRMRSSPAGRPSTVAGNSSVSGSRRTYVDGTGNENLTVPQGAPRPNNGPISPMDMGDPYESEGPKKILKKMKSADDMRRNRSGSLSAMKAAAQAPRPNTEHIHSVPLPSHSPLPSPLPPTMMPLPPSRAPSMFGAPDASMSDFHPERPGPTRFISLGVNGGSSALHSAQSGTPGTLRRALTSSLYDDTTRQQPTQAETSQNPTGPSHLPSPSSSQVPPTIQPDPADNSRDKGGRKWGFLKKMSMSKIRGTPGDRSPPSNRPQNIHPIPKRPSTAGSTTPSISKSGNRLLDGWPSSASQNTPSGSPQLMLDFSTTTGGTASLSRATGNIMSLNSSPSESPSLLKTPSSSDVTTLNSPLLAPPSPNLRSGRRRSFLPIDTPPVLTIPIPKSPFLTDTIAVGSNIELDEDSFNLESARASQLTQVPEYSNEMEAAMPPRNEQYARALRSVMAYLRDMADLSPPLAQLLATYASPTASPGAESSTLEGSQPSFGTRSRSHTIVGGADGNSDGSYPTSATSVASPLRSVKSSTSLKGATTSVFTTDSGGIDERKYKDDKAKRANLVLEIVETERTYVKGLQELNDIYITPATAPVTSITGVITRDTVIPAAERKIVFNGVESLHSFHMNNFLPALENAVKSLKSSPDDPEGSVSSAVAKAVANIFVSHAAFMKMYSTYINNFDNSLQRLQQWSSSAPPVPAITSPATSTVHLVGLGLSMSAITGGVQPDQPPAGAVLTSSQRKRVKTFLKRARLNPRHSQLNLEGYLLLPIQRIPRYKMMLEQLVSCTPPKDDDPYDDPIEKALVEISSLANNMNEGKRESESRRKLVQWQMRIRGKFPSPLVQPHRRLIMDGRLQLSRVVRKTANYFEVVNPEGSKSLIQVDCLAPESNPRLLIAILCNDLLVLCKDPSNGSDSSGSVELWAVLRMQTLSQPASMHAHTLRLVDHKAILYFDMPSTSDALTWSRAINMHVPASR